MSELKKSLPQNGSQWLVATLAMGAITIATALGTWALTRSVDQGERIVAVEQTTAANSAAIERERAERQEIRRQLSSLTSAVTSLTEVANTLRAEVERLRERGGG